MAERYEINAVISEEMKSMSNALLQLGQAYYEKHSCDFEPEFEAMIASIKYSEERIASVCMQTQNEEKVNESEIAPEYDDTVPAASAVETIAEVPATLAVENYISVQETAAAAPVTESSPECCLKCGAPYEENAAFCNNCGAPKNAPENDGLIMCPSCKGMIRPGTNFCTACGAVMSSAMPVSAPVTPVHAEAAPVAPAEIPIPPVAEEIYTPAEEIEVMPASAAPKMNTCPACGAPIIQEGYFCTACGSRLN